MTAPAPDRLWCLCAQSYNAPTCVEPNRCVHRFPSRHPELWVDQVHDACGGEG